MQKSHVFRSLKNLFLIVAGSAIFALGFDLFLDPNQINVGGVSGLGMLLTELTGFGSTALWSLLINVPIFLISIKTVGRKFFVGSLVGMLLHTFAPMRVVKSDGYSLMQHNLFLWEVEDRDFVYADKLSDGGRILSDIADAWVDSYTENERRALVDALFTAIERSGATDALDLFSSPRRTIELLLEATRQVEEPMRDVLVESVKRLAEVTAERIGQNVSDLLPLPRR